MHTPPPPTRIVKPTVAAVVSMAAIAASLLAAGCGKSPPPRESLVLPSKYAELLGDPPAPPKLDLVDVDHAVVAAIQRAADDVRKNADSADTWGQLGMVLLAHEFDESAAACFAQTEILQPDEPRWPYFQAMSVVRLRPNEAVPVLERAVSLLAAAPPANAQSGTGQGWSPSAFSSSASTDEALKKAEQAAAIRLRLLELYLELARPQDAEEPLRAFLASNPKNGRAHLIAARIALRAGRFDECLREVELAGHERPAQKPIHELRAEAYNRLGRKQEAESERRLAVAAQNVGWPGPYDDEIASLRTGLKVALTKADHLYVAGRSEASIDVLKTALEEYPQSEWAWILMGRAQIRLRQLDEAEESLGKALAIAPNSADALFRMGVVHSLRENHQEAAIWFRKVIEQKPDHPVALYNLGHGARQMGQTEEAIRYFRKAIECGPDYFAALCALGDALADEGRIEEARGFLIQAKQLRPNDRWVLGRLYRLPEKSVKKTGAETPDEQTPIDTPDERTGEKTEADDDARSADAKPPE